MGNVIEFKKNDEQITEVIEVATSQLTEHSKQAEYSPPMSKKKWAEFVASVKEEGLHQPIIVSRGFKVIGNTYHFRAAKEIGLNNVKAVFMDVTDNGVPSFIANNILQAPELKPGQRAAIVIRLHYEEERQKAKSTQGARTDLSANLQRSEMSGEAAGNLAKRVGMSTRNLYYLIAVYRNRPDLFELVFDGTYTINKAYTQMKADEEPEQEEVEHPIEVEKKVIEQLKEKEANLPQIDESEPLHSLNNRLVQMRKNLLLNAIEVIDESDKLEEAPEEIRESVITQARSMAISCTLLLGKNSSNDKEYETLMLIYELFKKLEEEQ